MICILKKPILKLTHRDRDNKKAYQPVSVKVKVFKISLILFVICLAKDFDLFEVIYSTQLTKLNMYLIFTPRVIQQLFTSPTMLLVIWRETQEKER